MSLTAGEAKILKSIVVASENNPAKPEFPADNPKFPATPTRRIPISGFTNVWLKDESYNPTGTHKDRMAWEIIVTYRDFLLAKKNGQMKGKLPQMSIISSGSAAFAIQTQLNKYGLPPLKVLLDHTTESTISEKLKSIGCELFETDLSRKEYSDVEILQLTKNPSGYDLTSNVALDPNTRFYDWLSYEILNASPEYCFIPFGTGTLYENILNINKKEVSTTHHDPRFKGKVKTLRNCHFFGATTNNALSKAAEKLYSPHLPFVHFSEQWIKFYKQAGFCGRKSDVYVLKEKFLDEAIGIAKKLDIQAEPSALSSLALFLEFKHTIPRDAKILIVSTGKTKIQKDGS